MYNDNNNSYFNNENNDNNENLYQNVSDTPSMQNHYYYGPENPTPEPTPKKTKKQNTRGKFAAVIAACMILSAGVSVGGTLLAQKYLIGNQNYTTNNQPAVINNSVTNTSASNSTTISEVVEAVQDTVVEITTEKLTTSNYMQQYVTQGAGSGVIISSNGYIITNHHVIDGASKITVKTKSGDSYDATIIGTDEEADIAVIKIDADNLKAAVLGDSDNIAVGETAIVIGNPLGSLGGTVTSGIISALDREITVEDQVMTLLQTNAAINPGNSGGGLFNIKGELIGIVNAKASSSGIEGLGFAIPVNDAKTVAEQLIEYGYVRGKVQLGVTLITISDEQTALTYRVSELGVYISDITANSDAYYGGLQVGDRIVSVNGQEVTNGNEVSEIVQNSSVGDTLNFVIVRNRQQMNVSITLTEYNNSTSAFNR